MSLMVVLPATSDSPAAARALVRQEMADCEAGAVSAAELLISELVTNAVVHASTFIEIEIEHRNSAIRAVVTDEGIGHPTVEHPEPTDAHGRGLAIVQVLAHEWGYFKRDVGKSVWFTLPCR